MYPALSACSLLYSSPLSFYPLFPPCPLPPPLHGFPVNFQSLARRALPGKLCGALEAGGGEAPARAFVFEEGDEVARELVRVPRVEEERRAIRHFREAGDAAG